MYDVARFAQVSTATVSRYFRSPDKLSPSTLLRVRQAVERLGYLPSGLARGLAERRTGMVGLYSFSGHEPDELERPRLGAPGAVPRLVEQGREPRLFPLFADEVLGGVEIECTLRRLPLAIGWQDGEGGGVQLDEIARRCDGVIVLPAIVDDAHLSLLARRLPVVLIAQPAPEGVAATSVTVDNAAGMTALAAHLCDDHGAASFWYAGPVDGADHRARFEGFAAALAGRGLATPDGPIIATGSRAGSRAALRELLGRRPELLGGLPDAVVCSSDQTALGVIAAFGEHGVAVPGRVAVTGFDGIDAGRMSEPPLTTIRQPMGELGREAVALLAKLLAGEVDPSASVVLPVSLAIRQSCGCPAPASAR